MARYRVGIIGCGGMGRSHAKAWSGKPQVELVAVADINEEAARRL
ncbi:MAG: gfo/Idh/MocA family oxidoreductase, partial [Candidatus Thorarchaeota archaeon]